ncbi:SMP-30/gluconolactonase/LRE family protein [Blastococcus sp. TBT05-19]|uniref:SMP-30/gluconolactonase/LRE family protein n=1 Tax=Blastococcus sp. TBT05-19 TaxID=2250581 RepID=UPI000DE8DCB0|nr:SMP-30/gluconolactonase/LRE family protein [Blastococcus sp. TBT05-19]RBY92171.1 SMP-30/gluconolactonase/LRE family protein [Blastococcus sp. TBT05-19]
MRAEQVTGPVAHHGEGPVWWAGWGGLRFVDMHAGDVLTLTADGGVRRTSVGSVAAALRPRRGGGAVLAVERGFALEEPDGSVTALPPAWSDEGIRMNEGGCDPDGRFWCGSMAYDQASGAASMYRLDPDGSVRRVFGDVTVSNGLEWSPDGSLAYYDDTATHRVDVFDYSADAGLTGRRPFVTMTEEQNPDGLTVDAEGGVWVALFGGGAVHRYDPAGRLDAVVEVAAAQVTACTFGGPDLDQLFITTSRQGLDPDDDPPAGSLFRIDAGVRGLPARTFAG